MDKKLLNFRSAKVYRKRDLFSIIFYWRPDYNNDFQRFRKTYGLNRIEDLELREQAAKIMAETVTEALKDGWNPIDDTFPEKESKGLIKNGNINISDMIREAHQAVLMLTDKERTISSYNSHFKQFAAWLKKNKYYKIKASEFDRLKANEYQQHLMSEKYAGKTINTKIDYASGLFKYAARLNMVPENPFQFLNRMKETESKQDIFTHAEIQAIKAHLLKKCPELWQYALFIYYCYMRPASIMCIKVKDIDIENKTLFIDGKNHKNGKDAVKQLLDAHIKYLAPYLEGLLPDDYLFSRKMQPGSIKEYPTRAAEMWKDLIQGELGIKKTAYMLKHTGSAHFIAANPGAENLKWLQMQMSHSDLQTTSIYTNKLKTVKLDETKTNIPEI